MQIFYRNITIYSVQLDERERDNTQSLNTPLSFFFSLPLEGKKKKKCVHYIYT